MATAHPNTVAGVYEVLERSFGGVHYVHNVLDQVLKFNKKWGSRDRSFVAEHTYEIVRNWRKLWALDAFLQGQKPLKSEPSLRCGRQGGRAGLAHPVVPVLPRLV